MKNPLEKFVPVEERADGIYIKVTRDNRNVTDGMEIISFLKDECVINFNKEKILDAVKRKRGGFEKIGPFFEYYNHEIERYVEVELKEYEAWMKLNSMIVTENFDITRGTLEHCLKSKGVNYGVNKELLDEFELNPVYDKEVLVAVGTQPERGLDGRIEKKVRIDPDFRPQKDRTGRANYRKVKSFVSVKKGQVLAGAIPPTKGKSGITVKGERVPAEDGAEAKLPQGKNTGVSDDGKYLKASETGVVYEENGCIHVREVLEIKKNVDFKVGNVKYTGDVYIGGDVKPGFKVETEGNIHICGEVEAAEIISRNGGITIENGLFGKGESYLFGKYYVNVNFAQECKIVTEGMLKIKKYCIHCNCVCNTLNSPEKTVSFVGGELKAYGNIDIGTIGNEKNVYTNVALLDKELEEIKKKKVKLKLLKEELIKKMEPLKKEIENKAKLVKKTQGKMSSQIGSKIKEIIDAYSDWNLKLKHVNKQIETTTAFLTDTSRLNGFIKVDMVFPNVDINLYGKKHFKTDVKTNRAVYKLDNEDANGKTT